MRFTPKTDAKAIFQYNNLVDRLAKFDMIIVCWGMLAVANKNNPYTYLINNIDHIEQIEGFVQGLEYMEKAEP
jgi:hypothetical protein